MESILTFLSTIGISDIIDITLVALALYKLMLLIRETRAEQLTKGIVALFVVAELSKWMNLYTMKWILDKAMTVGVLALLIVFQPELRRALEYIGRSNFLSKPIVEIKGENVTRNTEEIVSAIASLARQKIGALIVLEKNTGLNEIIESGTRLEADISTELLINIFIPNTPLHDGAVVIRGDKIMAAGCFLPLTENKGLAKELGTRHRAALGITERSDALTIVVSEETGAISVSETGKISRYIDEETLRQMLTKIFTVEENGLLAYWRKKDETDS